MPAGQSFRVKLLAMSAGVALSIGAWTHLSDEALSKGLSLTELAALPLAQPTTPLPPDATQGQVALPDAEVPTVESALFGMQEALKSVGGIFSHAVTLDVGGGSGSAQSSNKREMVRSVGGAKFVAVR